MSLLLDALQRASKEKEKSADATAAAAQLNPPHQATQTSTEPLPAMALEPRPSAAPLPDREPPPPLALSPAVSESQDVADRAETARQAPSVATTSPETKAAASPAITMQPPPAPPSAPPPQTSARPMPGPGVAREILNATAKTQPAKSDKRMFVLGAIAVLLTVTSSTLFLIFRDDISELPLSLQALMSLPADQRHVVLPPSAPHVTESAAIPGATASPPLPAPSSPVLPDIPVAAPLKAEARQQTEPTLARPQETARTIIVSHANNIPVAPVFVSRPGNSGGFLEAGYAALIEGHLDAAAEAYRRAIGRNPDERDALLGLAYIAHRQGRREEALTYYERVLRQEPGHPVANAGLLTLLAEGDLQNSTSRAIALAEHNPESAAAFATLGSLMVRSGRIADAQQAFFRAVTLEPNQPLHAYNLAVALDRLHKYEQARSYYARALALAEKSAAGDRLNFPTEAARNRLEQLRISEPADQSVAP